MENAMASKNIEKIVEIIDTMPLLEVADLVKALEEKYGVSSAMPMMAAPAAASAAPVEEEKAQYKVTLQEGGPDKVKSIKALRQVVPTLNLTDAKKAVESAPTVIAEAAPKEEAEKMKKVLEEAGAKVQLA
jgi:large subunit ribosomal protein L7/L12